MIFHSWLPSNGCLELVQEGMAWLWFCEAARLMQDIIVLSTGLSGTRVTGANLM